MSDYETDSFGEFPFTYCGKPGTYPGQTGVPAMHYDKTYVDPRRFAPKPSPLRQTPIQDTRQGVRMREWAGTVLESRQDPGWGGSSEFGGKTKEDWYQEGVSHWTHLRSRGLTSAQAPFPKLKKGGWASEAFTAGYMAARRAWYDKAEFGGMTKKDYARVGWDAVRLHGPGVRSPHGPSSWQGRAWAAGAESARLHAEGRTGMPWAPRFPAAQWGRWNMPDYATGFGGRMHTKAYFYKQGFKAEKVGVTRNPYKGGSWQRDAWDAGWYDAAAGNRSRASSFGRQLNFAPVNHHPGWPGVPGETSAYGPVFPYRHFYPESFEEEDQGSWEEPYVPFFDTSHPENWGYEYSVGSPDAFGTAAGAASLVEAFTGAAMAVGGLIDMGFKSEYSPLRRIKLAADIVPNYYQGIKDLQWSVRRARQKKKYKFARKIRDSRKMAAPAFWPPFFIYIEPEIDNSLNLELYARMLKDKAKTVWKIGHRKGLPLGNDGGNIKSTRQALEAFFIESLIFSLMPEAVAIPAGMSSTRDTAIATVQGIFNKRDGMKVVFGPRNSDAKAGRIPKSLRQQILGRFVEWHNLNMIAESHILPGWVFGFKVNGKEDPFPLPTLGAYMAVTDAIAKNRLDDRTIERLRAG